ncbi:MAG: chorismate synthase [Actinomycetota bacterium]
MGRLRYLTAGESHGPALVAILEGLPAGLPVSIKTIADELARRRLGYGRGPRMKVEQDELEILSGVRAGLTLGSPVAILIRNSEWAKWAHVMPIEGSPGGRELTRPRPGHADLPGMLKYEFEDARNVLERASARETAARAAIGSLAKTLLSRLQISVLSHVVSIGEVEVPQESHRPTRIEDLDAIDASPVRCLDEAASAAMSATIDEATAAGESLGGVIEILAFGLHPGLGSHVHWDRRIDGRLAGALMGVPAIKGVEVGDGFVGARRRGSQAHDEIEPDLSRATLRAGGTEGGMTIGGTLRLRLAMKPLSTLKRRLRSVDLASGEPAEAFQERTDVCAVPAAGVVCEAVVALVLADAIMEQFGGDTIDDLVQAHRHYTGRIRERGKG